MSAERGEVVTLSKAVINGRYSASSAVALSSPTGVLNVTRSLCWGANISCASLWDARATFLQLLLAHEFTNTCCIVQNDLMVTDRKQIK